MTEYDNKKQQWFNDIWGPIIKNKDIIINEGLALFLYQKYIPIDDNINLNDPNDCKNLYKSTLKKYYIPFTEVKRTTELIKEYPSIEFDNCSTWIKISPENFKISLSLHLKDKIKAKTKPKIRFNPEIIVHNFLEINEVFYIMTSRNLSRQNIFKIGGVKNENMLDSKFRISKDLSENDTLYFVALYKTFNYKLIKAYLTSYLSDYKMEYEKDTYKIKFNDLTTISNRVVEQCNKEIKNINLISYRLRNDILTQEQTVLDINKKIKEI